MPFPTLPVALRVSLGLPLPTSTPLGIHQEVSRVRQMRLKRFDVGGVFRQPHLRFVAPQRYA